MSNPTDSAEAKPVRKRRTAANAASPKPTLPETADPAEAVASAADLTLITAMHDWDGHALVVANGFVCTCHARTNRYPLTYSPGDVIPRGHDQLSHLLMRHLKDVTKL